MTEVAEPRAGAMVTAGVLLIGNELLSGRTQDVNLNWLAIQLGRIGIRVMEARVVPDVEADIITALNALRRRWRYVFTTGGIGPTHDDITAASIAKAFGVSLYRDPQAVALLAARIGADRLNEARLKMADVPQGGRLIINAASGAPGFAVENVYVLAGVPAIMQSMFDALAPELEGGAQMLSRTVETALPEGTIADRLTAIQADFPAVEIGSYPWYRAGASGVALVVRGTDPEQVAAAEAALIAGLAELAG